MTVRMMTNKHKIAIVHPSNPSQLNLDFGAWDWTILTWVMVTVSLGHSAVTTIVSPSKYLISTFTRSWYRMVSFWIVSVSCRTRSLVTITVSLTITLSWRFFAPPHPLTTARVAIGIINATSGVRRNFFQIIKPFIKSWGIWFCHFALLLLGFVCDVAVNRKCEPKREHQSFQTPKWVDQSRYYPWAS